MHLLQHKVCAWLYASELVGYRVLPTNVVKAEAVCALVAEQASWSVLLVTGARAVIHCETISFPIKRCSAKTCLSRSSSRSCMYACPQDCCEKR